MSLQTFSKRFAKYKLSTNSRCLFKMHAQMGVCTFCQRAKELRSSENLLHLFRVFLAAIRKCMDIQKPHKTTSEKQ